MSGGSGDWLRSSAARALVLAALVMSLVLGTGFIVISTAQRPELEALAPLTDEQSRDQVVDSARQIIEATQLQGVSGSAVFLSCTSLHDPPYQAAVYLNFQLPETNSIKRIKEIAAAMEAHGWREASATGEHFGLKLIKEGVTVTFHENPDDAKFATMRIYGECRNTADHRNDNPAWIDVTDQFR